ncbi:MAG: ABC transporter permease, partial [Bacillota bacterium]|nr:ABC transporter permease [Bacillota bacterium]
MAKNTLSKLARAVLVILGVSVIVFYIMHLTGNPANLMLPLDATQEQVDVLRQQMGLNDPIFVQYGRFMRGVMVGD